LATFPLGRFVAGSVELGVVAAATFPVSAVGAGVSPAVPVVVSGVALGVGEDKSLEAEDETAEVTAAENADSVESDIRRALCFVQGGPWTQDTSKNRHRQCDDIRKL
jgi:hypothetical protein